MSEHDDGTSFGEMKGKFVRVMRANLNDLLDRIKEFDDPERSGSGSGFEHIGNDTPSFTPPRSEHDKTLRDYYANLEVEYGADMETVKASYRRLMRKYHPDKFSSDPQMEDLSTKLSQELTRAYRAVESYWKTGKY